MIRVENIRKTYQMGEIEVRGLSEPLEVVTVGEPPPADAAPPAEPEACPITR